VFVPPKPVPAPDNQTEEEKGYGVYTKKKTKNREEEEKNKNKVILSPPPLSELRPSNDFKCKKWSSKSAKTAGYSKRK
jgi:hypothetical protein